MIVLMLLIGALVFSCVFVMMLRNPGTKLVSEDTEAFMGLTTGPAALACWIAFAIHLCVLLKDGEKGEYKSDGDLPALQRKEDKVEPGFVPPVLRQPKNPKHVSVPAELPSGHSTRTAPRDRPYDGATWVTRKAGGSRLQG